MDHRQRSTGSLDTLALSPDRSTLVHTPDFRTQHGRRLDASRSELPLRFPDVGDVGDVGMYEYG